MVAEFVCTKQGKNGENYSREGKAKDRILYKEIEYTHSSNWLFFAKKG